MHSFKKITTLKITSICCGMIAASSLLSCSDWDDHFAADDDITSTATQTIWENICERQDLSQFKALVEKAGLVDMLNEVNSYTVWVPKNGTFDYDSISRMESSLIGAHFVKNHVAQYAHTIMGLDSMRVMMLNLKKKDFMHTPGKFTIAGINVSEGNIAAKNGFIHVIDEYIPYRYSIFESLGSSEFPIDSVSDFIHKYDIHELDLAKSTEGSTMHGERTYLDSVFIDYNRYLEYGPFINEEDSNYSMIVPTNVAWQKARAAIKSYYNYAPSFSFLTGTLDSERTKNTKKTNTINTDYYADSLATEMLMNNLFINNNLYGNAVLNDFDGINPPEIDSLMFRGENFRNGNAVVRTASTKIYRNDARELMQGMIRQEASNGNMFITDTLRWHPWNYWNAPIVIEGERARIASTDGVVGTQNGGVGAGQQNPLIEGKVSGNGFLSSTARANRNPKIDIYLENVLSTEYNIYVVVLPNNITNIYDTIPKKNQLQFIVGNNDENGELTTWGWQDGEMVKVNNSRISTFLGDVIESDPTKIDTLYVGTINFPIAYKNFPEVDYHANPFLRIEDCVEKWNGKVTSDLKLDCIILVPTEFDAYLRKHPEYYDDRTNKNKWPLKPGE